MQVIEVRLEKIKVKDRAREDKGDIEGLAEAISRVGLLQPITLDQSYNLIAGERRYLAHRLLRAETIKAIVRPINEQVTALEIELLENIARKDLTWPERSKLELKIWNLMLKKHGEWDATLNPKGWTQDKQAALTGIPQQHVSRRLELAETLAEMPELEECATEDEAWKVNSKLKEHGAQMEMLKKLPKHILHAIEDAAQHYHIGDAFAGMQSLEDESCHFAEVDPPYGVDLGQRKSRNQDERPMGGYHEWEDGTYPAFFTQTAELVYAKLKHNSFAVFWYGMTWHHEVLTILRKVGFGVPDIPAVWTKGEAGQTASPDTTLGSCYEPFFLARKDQPKLAKPGRGNVFNYPGLARKVHPTEKPLPLMEDILKTILLPGSIILVPFLGSGVTLRAAYKLGHTGFGWDLSQDHKDGFLKRVAADQDDKGKG